MSDDDEQRAQAFMEQLRERLARPIPTRAEREMDLAVCIDRLGASLAVVQQRLAAAKQAAQSAVEPHLSGADANPPTRAATTAISWAASLDEVGDSFAHVDRDGLATILAVRTLLQI